MYNASILGNKLFLSNMTDREATQVIIIIIIIIINDFTVQELHKCIRD